MSVGEHGSKTPQEAMLRYLEYGGHYEQESNKKRRGLRVQARVQEDLQILKS